MVRADPSQLRPVVNRQGRGWHWLSACDTPLSETDPTPRATSARRQIRLFGLLLRLVRAGECRVGHDPTAHGCLAALRALDSRERPTCEKDHFTQYRGGRATGRFDRGSSVRSGALAVGGNLNDDVTRAY